MLLGQDMSGNLGFVLDGLRDWINNLKEECNKKMKTVETDKNSDFRNSQRVETTGAERLGENKEGASTRNVNEQNEEFVQE